MQNMEHITQHNTGCKEHNRYDPCKQFVIMHHLFRLYEGYKMKVIQSVRIVK
jgi:hypothetical protein